MTFDEYTAARRSKKWGIAVDDEAITRFASRPPTPTGWSDTDWLKHLQEQQHPLAGLHINQGSMDAAADAYEAEYNARHNAKLTGLAPEGDKS